MSDSSKSTMRHFSISVSEQEVHDTKVLFAKVSDIDNQQSCGFGMPLYSDGLSREESFETLKRIVAAGIRARVAKTHGVSKDSDCSVCTSGFVADEQGVGIVPCSEPACAEYAAKVLEIFKTVSISVVLHAPSFDNIEFDITAQ